MADDLEALREGMEDTRAWLQYMTAVVVGLCKAVGSK